jgi:dihydrofolate reductase
MNYFGEPIQFIFSQDLNGNTAKGAGELVHTNPKDFLHFKTRTKGNIVIMGYKTYITLDKPLSDRINVVYSELPLKSGELRSGFLSLQDSAEVLRRCVEEVGMEVFCIGGVQTFESMMKHLNSLPQVMFVTTHMTRAEDGNCPATFLQEIEHRYNKVCILRDFEEGVEINVYNLIR